MRSAKDWIFQVHHEADKPPELTEELVRAIQVDALEHAAKVALSYTGMAYVMAEKLNNEAAYIKRTGLPKALNLPA